MLWMMGRCNARCLNSMSSLSIALLCERLSDNVELGAVPNYVFMFANCLRRLFSRLWWTSSANEVADTIV